MMSSRHVSTRNTKAIPPTTEAPACLLGAADTTDAGILAEVRRRITAAPLLDGYVVLADGHQTTVPSVLFPEGCAGSIDVHVKEGVVTLRGEVAAAADGRLMGDLARAVPGCCAVVNALHLGGFCQAGLRPPNGR